MEMAQTQNCQVGFMDANQTQVDRFSITHYLRLAEYFQGLENIGLNDLRIFLIALQYQNNTLSLLREIVGMLVLSKDSVITKSGSYSSIEGKLFLTITHQLQPCTYFIAQLKWWPLYSKLFLLQPISGIRFHSLFLPLCNRTNALNHLPFTSSNQTFTNQNRGIFFERLIIILSRESCAHEFKIIDLFEETSYSHLLTAKLVSWCPLPNFREEQEDLAFYEYPIIRSEARVGIAQGNSIFRQAYLLSNRCCLFWHQSYCQLWKNQNLVFYQFTLCSFKILNHQLPLLLI